MRSNLAIAPANIRGTIYIDVAKKNVLKNITLFAISPFSAKYAIASRNGGQIFTPIKKPNRKGSLPNGINLFIVVHSLSVGKFLYKLYAMTNAESRIIPIAIILRAA